MRYYPPRYLFRRYEILRRIRPGGSFLEIGAGSLYLATDLLGLFANGTVVEPNPAVAHYYSRLDQQLGRRLRLLIGTFPLPELADRRYDCVVACEVLEHIDDDWSFLVAAAEHLGKSGQLVLSVPARMKLWAIDDEAAGHVRRYEKAELISIVERAGLKNIVVISYGFPFLIVLRWLRIVLARLRRGETASLTRKQRAVESGMLPDGGLARFSGVLCNPRTVRPLARISSLFENGNLAEGYIVTADRE